MARNSDRGKPAYDGIDSLAASDSWNIDDDSDLAQDNSSGKVPVLVYSIIAGEDCDLFWEHDKDDDGTFEISIKVASISANSAYEQNDFAMDFRHPNIRLRVKNTGNSSADFGVIGYRIK